tara:strand:+ start:161 stop:277 length:117 start_codon:yes stop_codon:yes gene_type:complete
LPVISTVADVAHLLLTQLSCIVSFRNKLELIAPEKLLE